jgi:hypothetical protein
MANDDNTSTNEETQDTEDLDLEDIEVSEEELNGEPEESTESEDEKEDTEPESKEEESKEDEDSTDNTEETKEDTTEISNKEAAARRIEEKRIKEAKIAEQQQEYIAEAAEATEEAVRQLQVDAYNNKVESNTNKLTNGYERAIKDFDILNSDDPAVRAEVDEAIDAFQAMHVQLDSYGNPIQVSGDLYSYLKNKADSISRLTGIGARQQAESKNKEKSKTFIPPSRTPKEPKVDPDIAAFDKEAAKP